MVDTVKLLFPEGQYLLRNRDELRYSSTEKGVKRYMRNPSSSELKSGMYLPRITLIQRPTRYGVKEELAVEFSAPKLIFGNNFDELSDDNFELVIDKLIASLRYLGIHILRHFAEQAKVVAWHPSKNIVFLDYFACSTVINTLRKVDISLVYDIQKTDFKDGEILHFHCNSIDIAFYDKLADLRKGKVSDKKATEKHNKIQLGLFDTLIDMKPLSVLRFEIRLNGVATVKRTFSPLISTELNLKHLFSSKLSQQVLLNHWQKVSRDIDYLSLDQSKPLELLENYLSEHENITPQSALAAVAGIYVANQVGSRPLRKVLDERFGAHVWKNLKPKMKVPEKHRYTHIIHVQETINNFQPTDMSMLTGTNTIAITNK